MPPPSGAPLRVLFVTHCPPLPTWGGAMAFFRHFCERDDFQVLVLTDDPAIRRFSLPYEWLWVEKSPLWHRLSRTRLYRWVHSWNHLFGGLRVPAHLWPRIHSFQPQVVLTVGGSWSWMATLAATLARRLRLPLAVSFNDWWSYHTLHHPLLRPALEARFFSLYRSCGLALCTSAGMRAALGPHPNAAVLPPLGSLPLPAAAPARPKSSGQPFLIGYGGNLGDWYGPMLEALVLALDRLAPDACAFRFFGSHPAWSESFATRVSARGWYGGQVPFDRLCTELRQADLLLLPMGFDPAYRPIESTSFKTKFLDYLALGIPILVWGPPWSTAAQTATEFASAEVCDRPDPNLAAQAVLRLRDAPARRNALVQGAANMLQGRFHPEAIHRVLVHRLYGLAGISPPPPAPSPETTAPLLAR